MSNTVLEYGNPPVIEVVFGVQCARLGPLLPPHVGVFWTSIKEAFPICQTAPPMPGDDGALWSDAESALPFPRIWLVSADQTRVIQIQNDRILLNWRKQENSESYPRFPALRVEFAQLLNEWRQFLSAELSVEFEIVGAELSYINVVERGEGWTSWASLSDLFPDFGWRSSKKRFLPPPTKITYQVSIPIEHDEGVLTIRVNPATKKASKVEVVRLELAAKQTFDSPADAHMVDDWLATARTWIVKGFEDVTSDEVQRRIWQKGEKDV